MRGITGKSKAMWHSGSSSVPKNAATSRGHWFASAISTRPGYSRSTIARIFLMNSWVSGSPSPLPSSDSYRYGIASSRSPSTPRSSQCRTTSNMASCTAGFSKLRSGWCEKNRWKKNWRRTGSNVQFDSSVSTKMMRMFGYFSSVSLQT